MDGKKHFVVEAKSQLNLWQGSLAAAIIKTPVSNFFSKLPSQNQQEICLQKTATA